MAAAALRRASTLRFRHLSAIYRANPGHGAASLPPPPSPRLATGWRSLRDAASAGRPTVAPHPSASASRATAPMLSLADPSPPSAPPCKMDLLKEAGYGSHARCSTKCGTCVVEGGPHPAAASPATPKNLLTEAGRGSRARCSTKCCSPLGEEGPVPAVASLKLAGSKMQTGLSPGVATSTESKMFACPCPMSTRSTLPTMGAKGGSLAKRAAAGPASSPWQLYGARRMMSSETQRASPVSSEAQKAPPVSQVLFDNEAQVNSAQWVCPVEFLKRNSPVKRWSTNKLNREFIGADPNQLTLSDVGISLLECLIYISLANCNLGYNQKEHLKKENLLINPKSVHFRLKKVGHCLLDRNSSDSNKNCIGVYEAACEAFLELLKEVEGGDVEKHMSVLVTDLFKKMKRPTDLRLIVFHPALLRSQGASAFFMRVFYLVRKVLRHTSFFGAAFYVHVCDHQRAASVKSHPLLNHIYLRRVTDQDTPEEAEPDESGQPEPSAKDKQMKENFECAKMAIEVPRHTIQHAFDKAAKEVKSCVDPKIDLWPYNEEEVLNLLLFVFGDTLIEVEEYFLVRGIWNQLGVENFWPRDLRKVGGVPAPTMQEQMAIRQAGPHLMDR